MIAIFMPPSGSTKDALRMSIWDPDPEDDPSTDITMTQMWVGLRIDDTVDNDQWAKEIQGWAFCNCAVAGQTIHVDSSTVGYQWMLIDKTMVDTLAFRKQEYGWTWDDAYHFEPVAFWSLLGGRVIAFDWVYDDGWEL